MGKQIKALQGVKTTCKGRVKVAGYNTLAGQLIGLYRAEHSPKQVQYRLVDNCSTHEIVYHTKQINNEHDS